jgi:hypothetical protein
MHVFQPFGIGKVVFQHLQLSDSCMSISISVGGFCVSATEWVAGLSAILVDEGGVDSILGLDFLSFQISGWFLCYSHCSIEGFQLL